MDNYKIKKYNQKEIIKRVSEKTGIYKTDLQLIFNAMEESVSDLLLSTDKDGITEIKLFTGLKLYGNYKQETIMEKNIISSVPLKVPESILISAKFTHGFKEKTKKAYRELKK